MIKDKCFDLGTIQAFIDGELTSDLTENVIKHIALCDSCALILAETEDESSYAFSVLDEELNVLVPTERLRTKVFDSIRESKSKESWWRKLTTGFGFGEGFGLRSPSFVAFASVVLFVCTVAIGIKLYQPMPSVTTVAVNEDSGSKTVDFDGTFVPSVSSTDTDDKNIGNGNETDEGSLAERKNSTGFEVVQAGGLKSEKENSNFRPQIADVKENSSSPTIKNIKNASPPVSPNLSGEDSYLQTISTLSQTVNSNKDTILRPTERVEFERDLAVVDDAIKKMKKEVRKNPKNQAAREVLRASYQNKIDLLNSVAERTELMASIN